MLDLPGNNLCCLMLALGACRLPLLGDELDVNLAISDQSEGAFKLRPSYMIRTNAKKNHIPQQQQAP